MCDTTGLHRHYAQTLYKPRHTLDEREITSSGLQESMIDTRGQVRPSLMDERGDLIGDRIQQLNNDGWDLVQLPGENQSQNDLIRLKLARVIAESGPA